VIKGYIFCDITLCCSLILNWRFGRTCRLYFQVRIIRISSACYLLQAGFLFVLFFNPEDIGDIFLWNVVWLSADYTVLYPRRYTLHIVACYLVFIYLLEYSPGGTTVSRVTILQHMNFTFDSSVRRLLRSPLNWISTLDWFDPSMSIDLTLHCL
jgi:hypothetical protein